MNSEKYGCWITDNIRFTNKTEAFFHASKNQRMGRSSDIKFWYHDELFTNVDKSQLGKVSLDTLYKERAQQLRDQYDYIILYYSGGSDSHNILKTFIDNNIKIDEVCTKMPMAIQDKIYTPNNVDTRQSNMWSEWDYCIVPILEWLKQYHPEIKITVKDFITDLTTKDIDNIFQTHNNHGFKIGSIRMTLNSDTEKEILDQGKTVGNIYGVDKPHLEFKEDTNEVYWCFKDMDMMSGGVSPNNPNGTEYFYWTPDMPILPHAQAYQLFLYYKFNIDAQEFLIKKEDEWSVRRIKIQKQNDISRSVIYTNWDNRFQAGKMLSVLSEDLYPWFFTIPELSSQKDAYLDNLVQVSQAVDKKFLNGSLVIDNKTISIPVNCLSKFYFIGNL